jgi:hypothetical protein
LILTSNGKEENLKGLRRRKKKEKEAELGSLGEN